MSHKKEDVKLDGVSLLKVEQGLSGTLSSEASNIIRIQDVISREQQILAKYNKELEEYTKKYETSRQALIIHFRKYYPEHNSVGDLIAKSAEETSVKTNERLDREVY